MKTIGAFRKTRYIGTGKVAWHFTFIAAANNLVRMRNLGKDMWLFRVLSG
jgi:hypothetical protein